MTPMIVLSLLALPALAEDRPAPLPEPLERGEWQLPEPQMGTLSNGIAVRVAQNSEVPLWEVRLLLGVGSYADPSGKEGLVELTFDMMDEGAGDRDAAAISRDLQQLAGRVGSYAGADNAAITASGIKRNMAETLDVWADVVRNPTFPEDKWEIVHKRTLSNLALAGKNPNTITLNVWRHLVYGGDYIGRHATTESVGSVGLDDARSLYASHVGPDNALILVGGDVTLDEVLPLLEERLGDWTNADLQTVPVVAEPNDISSEVIYLVDNPGAAQSVVRTATQVGTLESEDHFDLLVGNQQFSRAFTGRINMNLREDKGYTYGARCFVSHRHGPGHMLCNTSVRTDATAASIIEIRSEVQGVLGDAPLTDEELTKGADGLAFGWPGQFETTQALLDLEFEIWRYGKPETWVTDYVPAVRDVTLERAQAALEQYLKLNQTFWLVVGDKATILTELEAIGLPIVELDKDGNPIEAETSEETP